MARFASRPPAWQLNYRVATLAAHATSFVGYFAVVCGLWTNANPIAISIITNGLAVVLAGFAPSRQTENSTILCICLTTMFLFYAIAATARRDDGRDGGAFDGTYAILCGVGHLIYSLLLCRKDRASGDGCISNEEIEKKGNAGDGSSTTDKVYDHGPDFHRNVVFSFGDADDFRIEGVAILLAVLGTMMEYRVFDFNLGFGLVFAGFSAICCCFMLYLINFARLRGRRIDANTSIQKLAGMLMTAGSFCFFLVPTVAADFELGDDISWWRATFGVVWLVPTISEYEKVLTSPSKGFRSCSLPCSHPAGSLCTLRFSHVIGVGKQLVQLMTLPRRLHVPQTTGKVCPSSRTCQTWQ